jgi:hypothetical protein
MSVAWAKASGKKAAGLGFEEKQRVIHVLIVRAVEESKYLLAVTRIVSGI